MILFALELNWRPSTWLIANLPELFHTRSLPVNGLTMVTGNTGYDAAGSILIGFLSIIVAVVVGTVAHSLLLDEAAVDIGDNVQRYLERQPCVLQVLNVWTINHGNNVMVTIKSELQPEMTVMSAVDEINAMERQIKQTYTRFKWIFLEIDNAD